MSEREYHDGAQDGLEALETLDPQEIRSFSDLLLAMRKTAFGGRRLGEAFDVLCAMIEDPECKVVLTLSGAMTIAKMGRIISSMIDQGMVQVLIATGALIAHGLSESVGKTHYRHHPALSDEELFRKGYNRLRVGCGLMCYLANITNNRRTVLDSSGSVESCDVIIYT